MDNLKNFFDKKIIDEIDSKIKNSIEQEFLQDGDSSTSEDTLLEASDYYVWSEDLGTGDSYTGPNPWVDNTNPSNPWVDNTEKKELDWDWEKINEVLGKTSDSEQLRRKELRKENEKQLGKVNVLIDFMIKRAKPVDDFRSDLDEVYERKQFLESDPINALNESELLELNEIYKRWK
jgi:hypothetical protein